MAMTEKDHQLLWNLVDQNCTPTEETHLNEQLQSNAPWQQELEHKLLLHEVMSGMEPKHTSMRFVKTIMENLPDLQARVVVPPLIPKDWIRNFIAASALFVLSLLIVSWGNAPLSAADNTIHQAGVYFSSLFDSVSMKSWSLLFSLAVGGLLLAGLDRWLKTGALHRHLRF